MAAVPFSKESVGDFLRRERELRRIALEEISRSTRISRPYLEALERNDFRFFSKPEFIPGFLRGYARHIGLDPAEVLARYEFQLDLARLKGNFHQLPLFYNPGDPAPPEETPPPESSPPVRKKERFSIRRSVLIQIVILVAALSISFYLYLTLKRLDNGPKPSVSEESPPVQTAPKLEKGKNGEPGFGAAEKKAGEEPAAKSPVSSEAGAGEAKTEDKGIAKKVQRGGAREKIIGNPDSRIYYLPGMKGYERAKKGKRAEFNSEEEAIKKGYRRGPS